MALHWTGSIPMASVVMLSISTMIGTTRNSDNSSMIQFVNTASNGCSFSLPATASIKQFHDKVASSCNVSFDFEIELLGKTIVSPTSSVISYINQIPGIISIAMDLNDIWGDGFRVPFKVRSIDTSVVDTTVYMSLFRMFAGVPNGVSSEYEWYQFIRKCVETQKCSIQTLCERFNNLFLCNRGQLYGMRLSKQHLSGSIDLSYLPSLVRRVNLERNSLTKVLGLHLVGKQLFYLNLKQNPMNVDLGSFEKSVESQNPLKVLRVSKAQISEYLLGIPFDKYMGNNQDRQDIQMSLAARKWIQGSTLDCLQFRSSRRSVKHIRINREQTVVNLFD